MTFAGNDYGLFVFARNILAKNPAVCLNFFYKCDFPAKAQLENEALWDNNLKPFINKKIGVMFDHHNQTIASWINNNPEMISFPTQALHHLANEGLADSVEFRRLARKFIRRAREHNCQVLFFPEIIFSTPKTQKILQHIAGSQLKIKTCDFDQTDSVKTTEKQKITIYHSLEDITFLKSRAEKLLGKKLKASDFHKK